MDLDLRNQHMGPFTSGNGLPPRPLRGPVMRWLFLAILAGFGAYKLMDMFPRDPFPDQWATTG